ncbi:hypothetical protein Dimus_037178 [Dionaea muscipula]
MFEEIEELCFLVLDVDADGRGGAVGVLERTVSLLLLYVGSGLCFSVLQASLDAVLFPVFMGIAGGERVQGVLLIWSFCPVVCYVILRGVMAGYGFHCLLILTNVYGMNLDWVFLELFLAWLVV